MKKAGTNDNIIVSLLHFTEHRKNIAGIVLAIAIGAGCSYLTPIASGTNQTMMLFTKLKFQDFTKFGWPLLIISWICCVLILPQVFPFF